MIWMSRFMLLVLVARHSALADVQSRFLDMSANSAYESDRRNLSSIASIFSPRMDFDQWKPLTGRGDPLRQDPTYDYEPPLLERVHYWLDDTRIEREHFPERKSEVLMLGVSSRRPSLGSRMPTMIPRRHQRPPPPVKYEDFAYKISDRFPMTILVPPPPPPLLNVPSHFVRPEDKIPLVSQTVPTAASSDLYATDATPIQDHITSSYALQEANLIYQSSSTNINNWVIEHHDSTTPIPNRVSSDYSGWGPTTLVDDNNIVNETHNLISTDYPKSSEHPYHFYRPMLSEAPPPPQLTPIPFVPTPLPTFLLTAPPTTVDLQAINNTQTMWSNDEPINNTSEIFQKHYEEPTTQKLTTFHTQLVTTSTVSPKPETTVLDMISSMMSMPLVDGPDRPEDNLYAHASEHLHVYKEHPTEDSINIETMQTMQPPPPGKISETSTVSEQNHLNLPKSGLLKKPSTHTHDPYLHMRFTTPIPSTTSLDLSSTDESSTISTPMYLIIQGHSKVKTYSSKPDIDYDKETVVSNEIPMANRTNEVKHLHTLKERNKSEKNTKRKSKSHFDLKSIIENGLGSIELQETDIGIKYDVSDGSDVPVEIYKKGIVENDENSYTLSSRNKILPEKRLKRQIDLEDLIPFDEETIEEYVYNFLDSKKNSTGITGLLAQAVTSDAAEAVDELEEDDDDSDEER